MARELSGRLSGPQVALVAEAAGFEGDALTTALAIAKAESSWDADAKGDTTLTDDTWGPSLGLWQIRSLKDQRGTGQVRDAEILTDPVANARSAFAISNGGTNWGPWSVWWRDAQERIGPGEGVYRRHLDEAREAVAALTDARDRGEEPAQEGGGWVPGIPDPGDAIDAIGGAADAATAPVRLAASALHRLLELVTRPLTLAGDALSWITDRDNWTKIALAIGAGYAIVYGLILIFGESALDAAEIVAGARGGAGAQAATAAASAAT